MFLFLLNTIFLLFAHFLISSEEEERERSQTKESWSALLSQSKCQEQKQKQAITRTGREEKEEEEADNIIASQLVAGGVSTGSWNQSPGTIQLKESVVVC